MAPQGDTPEPVPRRDYSGLIILGALALLEVAMLYILIAVETPVTPLVRRALENPAGIFTLVMAVVTLLSFGMAGFFWWVQWLHKRRSGPGRAA